MVRNTVRRQGGRKGWGTSAVMMLLGCGCLALLLAGCAEKKPASPVATEVPAAAGAPAASGEPVTPDPGPASPVNPASPNATAGPAGLPGDPAGANTVRLELRHAVAQLVEAKNKRDAQAILACYAPNARVMTWAPGQGAGGGDVMASLEQYKEMLPAKVEGWKTVDRQHLLEFVDSPRLHGNELWVEYIVRIHEMHQGGPAEVRARFSARMVKHQGRWLMLEERYAKAQ
ncbi:nuclear transport factor 2 family protein [Megalodesulfovibrio paquesii]